MTDNTEPLVAVSEATRDLNETVRSVSADIALFAACCAVSEKHDPNWTGIKAKAEEWVFDLRAALASLQPPQDEMREES